MKKIIAGLFAALVLVTGAALAQVGPFGMQLTSPVVVPGSIAFNGGTQVSAIRATGGTFTCTSSGTITITNSNVTANSVFLFGLKTAATPAAFTVSTVTPGTGFTVVCGSDTSRYNYWILG